MGKIGIPYNAKSVQRKARRRKPMTTCKHCEAPFDPATAWQEFCSARCRNSWHYITHLAAERKADRKRLWERKRLRQREPHRSPQLDAVVATIRRQQEPVICEPAVAMPRVRRA